MAMKNLKWDFDAWEEYLDWYKKNKAVFRRVNALIKDMMRDPYHGIGKPEALKGNLSGLWSRRIDAEHRIVYFAEVDTLVILQCKGHYK